MFIHFITIFSLLTLHKTIFIFSSGVNCTIPSADLYKSKRNLHFYKSPINIQNVCATVPIAM